MVAYKLKVTSFEDDTLNLLPIRKNGNARLRENKIL